ncbi:hypothetical protein NLN86_24275 [Citrobacter portucalensis]|uniref:Uncharacterized protein n=1 Tax=Citrobacter portucalensis TaxID=1639133 RepID=A0AAW5WFR8_9ENTR|nr:hypothetical protein [Citrobacter portucalensis]MCX9004732.1 hypothetical protein [Citrobacter portucalensis]
MSNIRRLQLLENAVLNYGGGIEVLMKRINLMQDSDAHGQDLLRDLYSYLRDVNKILKMDVNDIY